MNYIVLFSIFVLINMYVLFVILRDKKKSVRFEAHLLIGLIGLFLFIQICTGFAWMLSNHKYVQQFGDTGEYLELSKSLKLDEYRMILYPLLLNFFGKFGAMLGISQIGMTYFIQTIISFITFFYFSNVLLKVILRKVAVAKENIKPLKFYSVVILISLFLITVPVVTQFNLAILVDSLSLSFLLASVAVIMEILLLGKSKFYNYVILGISLLLQFQLRVEREYVFIFLLVLLFVYFCKSKGILTYAFKSILPFAVILVITMLSSAVINKNVQQPGLYNRPPLSAKTSLVFLPLWPNFELGYDNFPDDFKNTFTIEEMHNVDQNANLVSYGIFPKLIETFGEEKAYDLLVDCDIAIIKNYPDRIITRAFFNVSQYLLSPLYIIFDINGILNGTSVWNFTRMNEATPNITSFYYKSSLYMVLILIISSVTVAIKRNKKMFARCISTLLPLFSVCVSISLVFGLLNSSAANYRYVLINQVLWYLLFIISAFCIIREYGFTKKYSK